MSQGRKQVLVAEAPDGTKLEYRTSAAYDYAGLGKDRDGWQIIAKGWSKKNVLRTTRSRAGYGLSIVVPFTVKDTVGEVPSAIAAHFERKRATGEPRQMPMITQVYRDGTPWEDTEPVPATFTQIRHLARKGVTSVAVQAYGSAHADFPVEPMLREASFPLLGGSLIGGTR
jgi:hypothetical protein